MSEVDITAAKYLHFWMLQSLTGISGDILESSQITLNLFSLSFGLYSENLNVRVPVRLTLAPPKLSEGGYETKLVVYILRTQPESTHLFVKPLKS